MHKKLKISKFRIQYKPLLRETSPNIKKKKKIVEIDKAIYSSYIGTL